MKSVRKILALGMGIVVLLTGCGSEQKVPEPAQEDVPELCAIIMGNPPKEGLEEIYAGLDELTVPELGCRVRFEFVPWGNEREQLNIAAASGEYDFIPGGTFSDYKQLAGKNAFLDLNDYLQEVPELVEHYKYYSDTTLEECEIDGSLYGIPQYSAGEIYYNMEGFFYREDLREAWGLEKITDLESMEAYLYRAKKEEAYKDEPLVTDNRIWQSLWILLGSEKYIEIGSMQETPFIVLDASDPTKVVNRLETEEFATILQYIRKWSEDGILESDMLALSDNEGARGVSLMLENKKPCETNMPIWAITSSGLRDLTMQHPEWKYEFFMYLTTRDTYYVSGSSRASVISISAKTKYPSLAIRFLEKIHTDQRYYDLLHYGVEGIHYHLMDERVSHEGISADNRFNYSVAGDVLLEREGIPVNEQFYEDAEVEIATWQDGIVPKLQKSPLSSYVYHTKGVEQEAEKIEEVALRMFQPLVCGYYENPEEMIPIIMEELQKAGYEEYVKTVEEQLKAAQK